jgi:hypothetical protein
MGNPMTCLAPDWWVARSVAERSYLHLVKP